MSRRPALGARTDRFVCPVKTVRPIPVGSQTAGPASEEPASSAVLRPLFYRPSIHGAANGSAYVFLFSSLPMSCIDLSYFFNFNNHKKKKKKYGEEGNSKVLGCVYGPRP